MSSVDESLRDGRGSPTAEKTELAPSPGFESFLISRLAIPRASVNGTVAPTNAKGNAEGATKNPLEASYFSRKSTCVRSGELLSPRLINSKLTSCPPAVEIRRFVSDGLVERAFTKTSLGSLSECSTLNAEGSPTTTAFTASRNPMAVTYGAATSTTVTLPTR